MPPRRQETLEVQPSPAPALLVSSARQTLAAIFRRPSPYNLDWRLVVELMKAIGSVDDRGSDELICAIGGTVHSLRKTDSGRIDTGAVTSLRHFLAQAGWTPQAPQGLALAQSPIAEAPDLLIVVWADGARLFHIDLNHTDPAKQNIVSSDPRVFLRHLHQTAKPRTERERTPDDQIFYEKITAAVAADRTVFVVSNAACTSETADRLIAFLRLRHPGRYKRIVCIADTDLTVIEPSALQLLLAQAPR